MNNDPVQISFRKVLCKEAAEAIAGRNRRFENKGLCRPTQVGVQKKNPAVLLCQRKGNICGNGGFAFVFAAACNQKELSVLLVMCPFYKDTKLMDGFRVIKAAGWVGNQQGFFSAL